MNFQNVYWHGKVHSGNHCSAVGFWEFLFERSKVQFFSSNAFSLRCFQGWCSIESPLVFTFAAFWFETSSALGNVFTSQCKRFGQLCRDILNQIVFPIEAKIYQFLQNALPVTWLTMCKTDLGLAVCLRLYSLWGWQSIQSNLLDFKGLDHQNRLMPIALHKCTIAHWMHLCCGLWWTAPPTPWSHWNGGGFAFSTSVFL